MIAFPGMLISAAKAANMKVPENVDEWDSKENKQKFPHFWVFCTLQLCRAMTSPNEHWENAKVIAGISEVGLKKMLFADFLSAGVVGVW